MTIEDSPPTSFVKIIQKETWYQTPLSIAVIGASGDLAKKKIYVSLFHLFRNQLLPSHFVIWGFARSAKSLNEFRATFLYPYLKKEDPEEHFLNDFLEHCFYQSGKSYGDEEAYSTMIHQIETFEESAMTSTTITNTTTKTGRGNRLYYLAIPPSQFGASAMAIGRVGRVDSTHQKVAWDRLVIEKPFGRDLESSNQLLQALEKTAFDEDSMYRIDHYLAKEMLQNLYVFRFHNSSFESIWNKNTIESVTITFKESFGTENRGGYFDQYGIIRDVIQNHLLQMLTLVAMEHPSTTSTEDEAGSSSDDSFRIAKLQVLQHMDPIQLEDVLLGQYRGYADDPTISNKDTNTPTFVAMRCWVHTPRWKGVPFILKAGKALDEQVCDIRIAFRRSSSNLAAAGGNNNELVLRLQPNPGIELHMNIKTPGFTTEPMSSAMKLDYQQDIPNVSNPNAYTRLLLDALRGNSGSFVRNDELQRSWELFTPLLQRIEGEKIRPIPYEYGSQGPNTCHDWLESMKKAEQCKRETKSEYRSKL
jgi:glucose-6-phosphate 1-dehydrogenase